MGVANVVDLILGVGKLSAVHLSLSTLLHASSCDELWLSLAKQLSPIALIFGALETRWHEVVLG